MNEKKDNVVKINDKQNKPRKIIGELKSGIEGMNFLKYFADVDKTISTNEKEHANNVVNAISGIKDDNTKAQILSQYIKGNNSKEIIGKIINAIKYLGGAALTLAVVVLLRGSNENKA